MAPRWCWRKARTGSPLSGCCPKAASLVLGNRGAATRAVLPLAALDLLEIPSNAKMGWCALDGTPIEGLAGNTGSITVELAACSSQVWSSVPA